MNSFPLTPSTYRLYRDDGSALLLEMLEPSRRGEWMRVVGAIGRDFSPSLNRSGRMRKLNRVATLIFAVVALLQPLIAAGASGVENYPQSDWIVARSGVSEAVDRLDEIRSEVRPRNDWPGIVPFNALICPSPARPPTRRPSDESLGRSPPPGSKLARG